VANTNLDLDEVNHKLRLVTAEHVVQWAAEIFGDGLMMTSSFGVQSAVMLHLVTRVVPDIPVIWIDTGFNFPETYTFGEDLTKRLGLNLKVYQSDLSPARMVAIHGRLWEQGKRGLDRYDVIRKIEPRDRAFQDLGVKSWFSGLRRDQTQFRKMLRKVEYFGSVVKIHPILDWTSEDVDAYLKQHDLPYHPLREKGYTSIGDWHSTKPSEGGSDSRDGRFQGLKQECGLHLPQSEAEIASRDSSGL